MREIFGSWRSFSEEPVLTTRIMVDVASAKLLKGLRFNPVYKKYEQDLEVCTRDYPGISGHDLAIGMGVLLTVLFGVFYAVAYAMHVFFIP